jgi:phosphatidylserine/phosphatidylglycerophosphate/cardiolipin synthase-like enzyme
VIEPGSGSPAERWFLSSSERGNLATDIDNQRATQLAWSEGNQVAALIHGSTYFVRLHAETCSLGDGDSFWFLDWRGDAGQELAGPGTAIGTTLVGLVRRGVDVRGMIWRSHPDEEKFSEQENAHLGKTVNAAGGEILLDERVGAFGSHHQKLVLIRRADPKKADVAFVGGIDLCFGRGDDSRHKGDPRPIELDKRYGPHPPWHDVQLELRGPVIGDLAETFRERWSDPTPLDHRNPWRAVIRRLLREPRKASTLPHLPASPRPAGDVAVQVLRTYGSKRPPYPFAPRGERSVAHAYMKAVARARSLIYVEDQYLWSKEVAQVFARALERNQDLRLITVVPRYPDRDGLVTGPLNRVGQHEAIAMVQRAGGDRVAIYDLENEDNVPIYVHAKVCIIDDVWATVGSDNLNRRSWTHDSELSCAVLDSALDERAPRTLGADQARVFARELRLTLWREHLGGVAEDEELLDAKEGFKAWRRCADSIDRWHAAGKQGARPLGRARKHIPEPVSKLGSWIARLPYHNVIDPDGRPAEMKRRGAL